MQTLVAHSELAWHARQVNVEPQIGIVGVDMQSESCVAVVQATQAPNGPQCGSWLLRSLQAPSSLLPLQARQALSTQIGVLLSQSVDLTQIGCAMSPRI